MVFLAISGTALLFLAWLPGRAQYPKKKACKSGKNNVSYRLARGESLAEFVGLIRKPDQGRKWGG